MRCTYRWHIWAAFTLEPLGIKYFSQVTIGEMYLPSYIVIMQENRHQMAILFHCMQCPDLFRFWKISFDLLMDFDRLRKGNNLSHHLTRRSYRSYHLCYCYEPWILKWNQNIQKKIKIKAEIQNSEEWRNHDIHLCLIRCNMEPISFEYCAF